MKVFTTAFSIMLCTSSFVIQVTAQEPVIAIHEVEGQPLAANVERLIEAFDYLGSPLPLELRNTLAPVLASHDDEQIQNLLDRQVLLTVSINPEVRVKVQRGPAKASLQQHGWTPHLVKVINQSTATPRLQVGSPQDGKVYAGVSLGSLTRQAQTELKDKENTERRNDRFLAIEMFQSPPMTAALSGLEVEYAIVLIYSSEAGKREATLSFDVGQGTQDLGFRAETPILFDVRPAVPVLLNILDSDGSPTTARLLITDARGRVYPSQAKRLAPDLFFQKQIYRHDGESVLLPAGEFTVAASRGPEYRTLIQTLKIGAGNAGAVALEIDLKRWIDTASFGFYSGDHHIHASGCAHYTSPAVGVEPDSMFRQVKGEGLNVGCVLTWGPGFDHQQQFFSDSTDAVSESLTQLKYDIEVSGFGSSALGHVCLLNLKEQIYPGANGSQDWPTWTYPVLDWAKSQGAITGYAHSGSGLQIDPVAAGTRLLTRFDDNGDHRIQANESVTAVLPLPFAEIDTDANSTLELDELIAANDRAADQLPNLAIPELNSVGAQEIFVTAAHGLCDFISAMDTARLREWNCWYHLMNCGLPITVSGETDFPCMSSTRVGQGRVYVQLGKNLRAVNFDDWCEGLAAGHSYVSDGYAHALEFSVNGQTSGQQLDVAEPGSVEVVARVAFSPEIPLESTYGTAFPIGGRRLIGDTVVFHDTDNEKDAAFGERKRLVEVVVNGEVVASRQLPADGAIHELRIPIDIAHSSWIAVRHFPQMHTNPVIVKVADKPVRASRDSALWSIACVEQLWDVRHAKIAESDRATARQRYDEAIAIYRRIAEESPPALND